MFNDMIVVQSAVSAFNNAALQGAAFLWYAILCLPLFLLVYYCGNSFLERIGWQGKNLKKRLSFVCVLMTLIWVVLFGGNYNVLRDSETVLPFVIASITFFASLFIGSYSKQIHLFDWKKLQKKQKYLAVLFALCCLTLVVLSDVHTWWDPILQVASIVFGLILGRASKKEISPSFSAWVVMFITTVALLMQPEFFRFGQLGSLTFLHLMSVGFVGICMAIVAALSVAEPKKAIRQSAYIKLKWLARFITLLCFALFVLTESIPVFLGMIFVSFLSVAMSVWHSDMSKKSALKEKMLAIVFMGFGVLTVMPALTAAGILYWMNSDTVDFAREIKALL